MCECECVLVFTHCVCVCVCIHIIIIVILPVSVSTSWDGQIMHHTLIPINSMKEAGTSCFNSADESDVLAFD